MRRRHLLLATGLCAAAVAALLAFAPGNEAPASREAANPSAVAPSEERQARLAAVEPDAKAGARKLGTSKFEVSMSPDGQVVLRGYDGVQIRVPTAVNRAEPAPPLQVFDDRGRPVAATMWATTILTLRPGGAAEDTEVTYRVQCEREDLPAQVNVPVRIASKSLVFPRAHVLRVRVESSAGAPIPFAQVLWSVEGRVNNAVAYADEEGRCTLTRLAPTEVVRLRARPPATASLPAVSPEFAVVGDADQDLLLVVEPESGGDLFRVRLEDAPELRGAVAVLVREPGGGVVARTSVSDAFACWFAHVPSAGTYTLWVAQQNPASPCVYATGLRPDVREQTVRAQPAQSLRVRPLFRGRPTGLRLTARRSGLAVEGVPEADGTYLFRGLPGGTVHVIGTAWSDDAEVRLLIAEADVSPGDEVSLTLR